MTLGRNRNRQDKSKVFWSLMIIIFGSTAKLQQNIFCPTYWLLKMFLYRIYFDHIFLYPRLCTYFPLAMLGFLLA